MSRWLKLLLLSAAAVHAAALGGVWKNRSYVMERQPGDSLTALFYENLTVSAEGWTRLNLDFHADLSFQNRWDRELSVGQKKAGANVAYMQAAPAKGWTAKAGRVAQARSFGLYVFDGGAAGWTGSRWSAQAWGGLLRPAPGDPDYVGEWETGGLWAAEAGYRVREYLKVQAGLLHREIRRDSAADFLDAGFLARVSEAGSAAGIIESDLAVFRPTRLNLNAFAPVNTRLAVTAAVNAQFLERDSLNAFERLRLDPYADAGLEGEYAFEGGRTLGAGLIVGSSGGETRMGYVISARGYGISARAELNEGYGVNQNLLSLGYAVSPLPALKASIRANAQTYRLTGDTDDRKALAAAPKLTWRPAGGLFLASLEYQFVSNRFYEYDHRVLIETKAGFDKFYKSE